MESTPRFQYDTLISYIKDLINLGEGNNCIDFLAKFSASSAMDFMVDTTTLILYQTYQTFSSQTLCKFDFVDCSLFLLPFFMFFCLPFLASQ